MRTLASRALNDGKFFDRLERGGGCTIETYERLMRFLRESKFEPVIQKYSRKPPASHAVRQSDVSQGSQAAP